MTRLPIRRCSIAIMLFLAAVLNYIDRQTLSILAPTIQSELKLDDAAYGNIVNLFLVAYTISFLLSGRLIDRIGVRVGMAFFVVWWSISNILTAFATSARSLGIVRFSLGLGEAGNWPGSTKAVSEWFPPQQRAFAIGFYTLGASIGATVAPVLVLSLSQRWGWQAAFVATGAAGLLWVPVWLALYGRPRADSVIATEVDAPAEAVVTPPTNPWIDAIGRREVWGLLVARFVTDPVWYFYQFWFAKYLHSERGLDQSQLKVTWVVYLAADIGCLVGGIASGYLIRRGTQIVPARMRVMLCCAMLMPLSMLIPFTSSVFGTLVVSMILVLAHLAWLANLTALAVDRIPRYLLATCFGIIAAGSAAGGILMNKLVVLLVEHSMYSYWFWVAGIVHPLAWIALRSMGMRRQD